MASRATLEGRNLTPEQWQLLLALPADGREYNVPGVAFRAVHKPQTRLAMEQVIAETAIGRLRRRRTGRGWAAVEYI